MTSRPLLDIRQLVVSFGGSRSAPGPAAPVVDRVDLEVRAGEAVGLVGASGSGKTTLARAIMGLVPTASEGADDGASTGAGFVSGQIGLEGHGDLSSLPPARRRRVRGTELGMIFQEPARAFNPVLTIGFQIGEALRVHPDPSTGRRPSRRQAAEIGIELLRRVAIPQPERRWRSYPHQLSGGQLQRAMIAMALVGRPRLLLADEPTTALDVTVQAQVLALLAELRRDLGLALLLITHDMAVVAELCDRVVVLDHGRVVEEGSTEQIYARPRHPITRQLLAAARARTPLWSAGPAARAPGASNGPLDSEASP